MDICGTTMKHHTRYLGEVNGLSKITGVAKL